MTFIMNENTTSKVRRQKKTGVAALTFGSGLAAVLSASVLLSGCTSTTTPGAIPSREVTFQHIHKLEARQTDGQLLVAAHDGLYQLELGTAGEAKVVGPIGGFDFDFMGFAIAGDTMFASGHPGPGTANTFGNPNLGLIASTDLGTNWTDVSLTGVTDFHALTAAVDDTGEARVFGIDTSKQRIQRSMDGGKTWTDGAEIAVRDILAVGHQLFATTQDGLAVSDDDGTSFVVDSKAPPLYLVTAGGAGQLAGVDINSNLWIRDAAGTWTSGSAVTGQPEALAIDGKRVFVADERGIAFTEDLGATWTVLTLRR